MFVIFGMCVTRYLRQLWIDFDDSFFFWKDMLHSWSYINFIEIGLEDWFINQNNRKKMSFKDTKLHLFRFLATSLSGVLIIFVVLPFFHGLG